MRTILSFKNGKLTRISVEPKFNPEEKRKRHLLHVLNHQKRYPERHKARRMVQTLVNTGQLPPVTSLPCVDCGKPAKEYDHISGYVGESATKVEPVCDPCHKKRGSKRGQLGIKYKET